MAGTQKHVFCVPQDTKHLEKGRKEKLKKTKKRIEIARDKIRDKLLKQRKNALAGNGGLTGRPADTFLKGQMSLLKAKEGEAIQAHVGELLWPIPLDAFTEAMKERISTGRILGSVANEIPWEHAAEESGEDELRFELTGKTRIIAAFDGEVFSVSTAGAYASTCPILNGRSQNEADINDIEAEWESDSTCGDGNFVFLLRIVEAIFWRVNI